MYLCVSTCLSIHLYTTSIINTARYTYTVYNYTFIIYEGRWKRKKSNGHSLHFQRLGSSSLQLGGSCWGRWGKSPHTLGVVARPSKKRNTKECIRAEKQRTMTPKEVWTEKDMGRRGFILEIFWSFMRFHGSRGAESCLKCAKKQAREQAFAADKEMATLEVSKGFWITKKYKPLRESTRVHRNRRFAAGRRCAVDGGKHGG